MTSAFAVSVKLPTVAEPLLSATAELIVAVTDTLFVLVKPTSAAPNHYLRSQPQRFKDLFQSE